ncbi:heavy metal-associated isoprenylated plant protein 39-like [Rhodamnia argentea]|uniref:Heavy metal-associated isoprenylated plant protein 39-like n=1 Tax=Rhodamnia argentea TaxID=178133 RepID=A0A8B8PED4_9MYRT|nr:heavy metal-associated isoprenylated plant protein 39-like [Rhodamnia argentea]
MQKAVLRVGWGNEKERKRAVKMISGYEGIQSVAVDLDNKKVTVIGDVDPVQLVENLRKRFDVDIDSLGPKESPTPQGPTTVGPSNDNSVISPTDYYLGEAYPDHPYPYPPYYNPPYPSFYYPSNPYY